MKTGLIPFSTAALVTSFFVGSLLARADRNPDFNQDAKPILRMQPHLLDYVEHNFDVRDVGLARIPGDEERHPMPPFIFQARPHGASGAYFITLLIEPGPQGRILKVVDPTHPHAPAGAGPNAGPGGYGPPGQEPSSAPYPGSPDSANQPPPSSANEAAPTAPPQAANPPAPTSQTPSGPTSATPSGPIPDSTDLSGNPAANNSSSLAPPPDPAPAH